MPRPTWLLLDDRAGNRAQVIGVAEQLGVDYTIKEIRYNIFAKLPNRLLGAGFISVDMLNSSPLTPPWPGLVIAAGRRCAPIARAIKKRAGSTRLVQLMWPGEPADGFDLIATPAHDDMPPAENRIITPLVPHRITQTSLREAADGWRDAFSYLPRPFTALVVGGNTKDARFSDTHWHMLADAANQAAGEGSLLITTSRRTGNDAIALLRRGIDVPHYFYTVEMGGKNPYPAILALADRVIVTGDSMSMCSEAVASSKPVFIYAPAGSVSSKHARMHQHLYDAGAAQPLFAGAKPFYPQPMQDAASEIAAIIRGRFGAELGLK